MKLTYDSQADAMYIALSDAEICSTKLIAADGNINADLDAEGNVVGVEIIGVQKCLELIDRESGLDIPSQATPSATTSPT